MYQSQKSRDSRRRKLVKCCRRFSKSVCALTLLALFLVCVAYPLFKHLYGSEIGDVGSLGELPIDLLGLDAEIIPDVSPGQANGSNQPKYRLVVVAKIGNEANYVIEWIEYHKLQGVQKFVLFLDDTPYLQNKQLETLRLLQRYYTQIGLPDLIDLRAGGDLIQDQLADIVSQRSYGSYVAESTTFPSTTELETETQLETKGSRGTNAEIEPLKQPAREALLNFHRLSQQTMLKQAFAEYKSLTEWIVHIDVDEFLSSSTHDTMTEHLQALYQYGDGPVKTTTPATSTRNGTDLVAEAVEKYKNVKTSSWSDDQELAILYQANNLSGMYLHARNFGISDSYWFNPTVQLLEDPVTGNITLHYVPFRPAMTADTSEKRLEHLIHNLTDFAQPRLSPPPPYGLLKKAYEEMHSGTDSVVGVGDGTHPANVKLDEFPFQIERKVYRAPCFTDDADVMGILDRIIQIWPECQNVKTEILSNMEVYGPLLHDKIRVKDALKKLSAPEWCVPGHMPNGLTGMGKSIIWTGNRYKPPPGFKSPVPMPKLWFELDETDDGIRNSTSRRTRKMKSESQAKRPDLCQLPWVHGCSHRTEAVFMIAHEIGIDHHMSRTMESRTVGDVSWRRGPGGWGKLQGADGVPSFTILQFTNLIYSPDTRDRFLGKLKEQFYKFHTPIKATETLRFENGSIMRDVSLH